MVVMGVKAEEEIRKVMINAIEHFIGEIKWGNGNEKSEQIRNKIFEFQFGFNEPDGGS